MKVARSAARSTLALAAALLAVGCASMDLSRAIRKPTAEVVGVTFERLTFEEAALRFDVKIENPNPIGIECAGFDYRLVVEGTEFLKGAVDRKVAVRARGESIVPVPVGFKHQALLAGVRALADHDESPYEITVGLAFELPVLGKVRVAATKRGTLPVVRLPSLRVASLQLESITLQGATLVLALELANPNGFALSLASLDYRFAVEGAPWASGTSRRTAQFSPRAQGRLELPVNLDFAAIGRGARELLLGRGPLAYTLSARLDLGTTHPLLPKATLPIELAGRANVTR